MYIFSIKQTGNTQSAFQQYTNIMIFDIDDLMYIVYDNLLKSSKNLLFGTQTFKATDGILAI